MSENSRRKADGYDTQQKIDEATMELVLAEASLDKLSNCPELSTIALREILNLKTRLNKAQIILFNARLNGK